MADEFEIFLAASVAPDERGPDRRFVAAVQSRIVIEERFAQQRRELVRGFVAQLSALLAVAAGLWWIGRSAVVEDWLTVAPGMGLALLLPAFALAVALFSRVSRDEAGAAGL
jgi:apolipoprotein N-acyltransferase